MSFLSPSEEKFLEHAKHIIYGNEESVSIRHKSIDLYCQMVADIGTIQMPDKRTLRRAMKRDNEASPWWYHSVAFRDPERDHIFNNIIKVLTIQKIAKEIEAKKIILLGAESCLAITLRSNYEVKEIEPDLGKSYAFIYLSGIASRLKYIINFHRQCNALKKNYRLPLIRDYEVVFAGFWDWSFWKNEKTEKLDDRYFKNLPYNLKARGIDGVGYFAWFDPDAEPDKKRRKLSQVLRPLNGRKDVVILQRFLKISDVIRALFDFYPLKVYKEAKRGNEFLNSFEKSDFNWFPLFEKSLLIGYVDSHISHCMLVSKAVERASSKYSPSLSLSFLEHFPYSRAYYEGMRKSKKNTSCWALQHAAYNHEKTICYLHPDIEFQGKPDGCCVPHPDKFFVMGHLSKKIIEKCGYGANQIIMSGSPRYDHIASITNRMTYKNKSFDEKEILLVCSLDVETELPMIEAATIAVQGIQGLRLRMRNHPFARVDQHPGYKQLKLTIEISNASLNQDLSTCDLIIFSYSTVAEEAFLRGIPVWQWVPQGFNFSALSEIMNIPRFGSVTALREAIKHFCINPELYLPSEEMIKEVAEQIFYPTDGRATERIAEECLNYLKKKKQQDLI